MKHRLMNSPSALVWVALACAAVLSAAVLPAMAMDTDPVTTTTLKLRGAGTRMQGTYPLYTASLYGAPALTDASQLRIVMARNVDAIEITALLTRGLVANASEDELSRLIPELFALGEIIGAQHQLKTGDGFQIITNNDRSTTIRIDRRAAQPVEVNLSNPELFSVMLKIWLGPQPADTALKQGLLGQAL